MCVEDYLPENKLKFEYSFIFLILQLEKVCQVHKTFKPWPLNKPSPIQSSKQQTNYILKL